MSSGTNNVKLGTCVVFYDGKDLGLTKGGVEVEVSTTTHEVKVDQFGETPIGELVTGRTVMANVPMAETTLENLVNIMPGSTLITDGAKATGTVTFTVGASSNNDYVEVLGQRFTFKTLPKQPTDMKIGADHLVDAQTFTDEVNGAVLPVSATVVAGVVTIEANSPSSDVNTLITSSGSNIAVAGLTGGVTPTLARVDVETGVNINLLEVSKELRLRPVGSTGAEDFVIHRCASPGALSFAYNIDQERIFTANFKGYPDVSGTLFSLGDVDAV